MSSYKVVCICDPDKPDENVFFMYTVGLYPERQELCASNVPRKCVDGVCKLMNFLSTRTLLPGRTTGFKYQKEDTDKIEHMQFVLEKPPKKIRNLLVNDYLLKMNRKAQVLLLLPLTPFPDGGWRASTY